MIDLWHYKLPTSTVQNLPIGEVSAKLQLPVGKQQLRIISTVDCYFRLGAENVEVTVDTGSFLAMKEVEQIGTTAGYTHIAVIRDINIPNGRLNITKLIER